MWDWPRRRAEDWVGRTEPSAPSASRNAAASPPWEVASCCACAGAVPRAVSGVRRALRTCASRASPVCRLPRSPSPEPSARAVARVSASATLAAPRKSTASMPDPVRSSRGRTSSPSVRQAATASRRARSAVSIRTARSGSATSCSVSVPSAPGPDGVSSPAETNSWSVPTCATARGASRSPVASVMVTVRV